VTVAMAVADNNRNCRGRQQSTKCGRGSGGDSSCGSNNCGSMGAMAGRGGSQGAAVAAAATVAIMAAYNNRNGVGRQQSTKCSSGSNSGRDSGLGNGNCSSLMATAAVALVDNRWWQQWWWRRWCWMWC
jgi:hypothetical protein